MTPRPPYVDINETTLEFPRACSHIYGYCMYGGVYFFFFVDCAALPTGFHDKLPWDPIVFRGLSRNHLGFHGTDMARSWAFIAPIAMAVPHESFHGIAMKRVPWTSRGTLLGIPWHPHVTDMEQFKRHGTFHGTSDGTAVGQFHGSVMGVHSVAIALPWDFAGLRGTAFSLYCCGIGHGTAMGDCHEPWSTERL